MDILGKITYGILDLIFPPEPFCVVCSKKLGAGERTICAGCESKLVPILPPVCKKCGRPVEYASLCRDCRTNSRSFAEARSFGHY
ncbi:MAG: hypothetical protein PWQ97_1469, partial [Tepidanaerobacteraceae bacterium]|nr:hypothetical protein [Tepidanaerobacteraceae bacterium]